MKYWVNTVSLNDVQKCDDNDPRLKRTAKGDRVVFYSPRTERQAGDAVQRFTAIGEVVDDGRVEFLSSSEAAIRPLIDSLDFIPNKKSWGVTFRRGFFEIPEADFRRIATAMSVSF
ncbi:MAG TPA: EVE domain-containing protein [Thermoanaerobaculia bacterium]